MSSSTKFTAGQRIRVSDTNNSWNGHVGKVLDPAWDYSHNTGEYTVRIQLDSEVGGSGRSFYESSLIVEDLELAPISVTRKQLKTWLNALQSATSDDPFNNDAEDAAKELDALVNPPAVRTYTVVVSGKINDIETALSNLEASDEVLIDKITVNITLTKEEKIIKDAS